MTCLALIDYPPGDEALRPLVRRVYDWLFSKHFLQPPLTAVYPGQEHRVRHCASMDGNAIWYSVRHGLEDERTRDAVDRLISWQWPDSGWNCDKRHTTTSSSFQESLIPARGLWAYGRDHGYQPALDAAQKVADLVLARRLLWHLRDGTLIVPDWGGRPDRIHYPIQFYDVLFALQVMSELGRIGDPRCVDALALLESKRLADGGFPLEEPNAATADAVASRHSYAAWGPVRTAAKQRAGHPGRAGRAARHPTWPMTTGAVARRGTMPVTPRLRDAVHMRVGVTEFQRRSLLSAPKQTPTLTRQAF